MRSVGGIVVKREDWRGHVCMVVEGVDRRGSCGHGASLWWIRGGHFVRVIDRRFIWRFSGLGLIGRGQRVFD